jgi:hypothetical protein
MSTQSLYSRPSIDPISRLWCKRQFCNPSTGRQHFQVTIQYVGLPSSLFPVAWTTSTEGLLFTLCNGTGFKFGRAIAQAANRRLSTATGLVRARVRHMGFVVNKVALGQVFSEYFGFPCNFSFHLLLHSHLHPGLVQWASSGQYSKWTQSHANSGNSKETLNLLLSDQQMATAAKGILPAQHIDAF